MSDNFQIILPIKAVSLNNAYSQNRQGRRFLTKEGKRFKEAVGYWCIGKIPWKLNKNDRFLLSIWFNFKDKRRRDIDDNLKLLIDALVGIAFIDDGQIVGINALKEQGSEKDEIILEIDKVRK